MAGALNSPESSLLSGENLRPEKVRSWPLVARKENKKSVNYQSVPKTSLKTPPVKDSSAAATSSGNIAAIDFGTTYCSIAYKTAASEEINSLKLNEVHARVPTAVLLKKGNLVLNDQSIPIGVECVVDSFGGNAQDQYQKLKARKKSDYLYFERMKMRLQHDKNVNRNMKIYSDNIQKESNNDWYLIEVIAFILRYLKDELIKRIKMSDHQLETHDFDWVITIPAIWQARGKQMMREAGYMAGLCSSQGEGICYLTYGSFSVQSQPSDVVPAKLSLVPEPEAAALYCQAMQPKHVAKFCDNTTHSSISTEQYIIIDIGGGTVDITAQERNKETGEIDVVLAPQGNDCGGMTVNKEFGRLLQRILGEKETREFFNLETAYPKLLYHDEGALKPFLNHILFNEFETQKEIFGRSSGYDERDLAVKIPHKITQKCTLDIIKKNIESLHDPDIELDDDCIYIKYSRVANLFKPAIEGILECTHKALTELTKRRLQFRTIYLVGGFGGCKYVYDQIKRFISREFPSMNYSLIVPDDHKLAVAHGAVRYKIAPVIQSRCLNRTYGIAVSINFDPKHHTKEHFKYSDEGDKICHDAFLTFIQRGTAVSTKEVAVDEILPGIDTDKIVRIPFYASEESSLEYLTNRPPTGVPIPLAEKVGELQFEFPRGDILYRDQRRFRVILDFSSVEITATVRYLNTDTDVKTNLDFLV